MFEKTQEKVRNAAPPEQPRRLSGKDDGMGQGNESLAEFLRRIDTVSAGLDEDGMAIEQPGRDEEMETMDFPVDFPFLGANGLAVSNVGWPGAEEY